MFLLPVLLIASLPGSDGTGERPIAGLAGVPGHAVQQALAAAKEHGPGARTLVFADLTQPSTAKRLYVIDLQQRKVTLRTWVAHGVGSGELHCNKVSDREGSHCSSRGMYRIGERIESPRHGPAIALDGLEPGQNGSARSREIIVHGADYVTGEFIARHGRAGRSWGCPAVSPDAMRRLLVLLHPGDLLYVHAP